jgi:hypothetical protein
MTKPNVNDLYAVKAKLECDKGLYVATINYRVGAYAKKQEFFDCSAKLAMSRAEAWAEKEWMTLVWDGEGE